MAKARKYTPERVEQIYKMIAGGVASKYAAQAADISEKTFYRWLKRFPKFAKKIERANGLRIASLIKKIRVDKSWQSAAWLLERLDRNIYHLPTAVERELVERIEQLEAREKEEENHA